MVGSCRTLAVEDDWRTGTGTAVADHSRRPEVEAVADGTAVDCDGIGRGSKAIGAADGIQTDSGMDVAAVVVVQIQNLRHFEHQLGLHWKTLRYRCQQMYVPG